MTRSGPAGWGATTVRAGLGAGLLGSVVYWTAFKWGLAEPRPPVFAALAIGVVVLAVVETAFRAVGAVRGRGRRLREASCAVVWAGLVVVGAGGVANWLFSLQGAVILTEEQTVQLSVSEHLQAFDPGPMSNVDDMRMRLTLTAVELQRTGPESFVPVSSLVVSRAGGGDVVLVTRPGVAGQVASLRFYQGAFGFAPRLVILKDDRTIFDEVVAFTTERRGPEGVAFEGRLSLEKERLTVAGAVSLASLDEQLRGHATLGLEMKRDGQSLGSGELLPGHFADLQDGYRVGFAGLKKWSEIDISRRSYPVPIAAGLGMMVMGSALWLLAVWRKS
ncbi:MAG: hypothetical protein HY903_11695 [Deltaproteobacteria bacterium]|nr:hypothetical protein [Deltaproteobacteria bacterium]